MNWSPGIGRRIEKPPNMRVMDDFLRAVGFVAELLSSDNGIDNFDHVATGVFVSIPIQEIPGKSFYYFVTAKHVIDNLNGRSFGFLVNKKMGGVEVLRPTIPSIWWRHPTDVHADVAVTMVTLDNSVDICSIGTDLFLGQNEDSIGIGDEVFTVGLFSYAPGRKRNMPIVRYGTIAMIPDEEIYVGSGFTSATLIEARSIGGISGSPVFARRTVDLELKPESYMHGVGRHYFLGLVHGHWDIRESEMNKPAAYHDSVRGVNMGIAVVVPAFKVLETINCPYLVEFRRQATEKWLSATCPGQD